MAQTGTKNVILKIRRQENPKASPRWEEFELTWKPGMNVISAMMEIAANPVTRDGKATTPIAYDSNCLEEVCGSCAMLINGKAAWRAQRWSINWSSRYAWSLSASFPSFAIWRSTAA